MGFPCGSAGKESACNLGDQGSIPGLGRFPGEGKGYPLQYSGLESSMDSIVHGVTKSQTGLSSLHLMHIYMYIYFTYIYICLTKVFLGILQTTFIVLFPTKSSTNS